MTIKLQFSDERTIGQGLVRWWTGHWATHVDAVLPDGRLLGARPFSGVQIREPDYHDFSRKEIVTISASAEAEEAFYSYLRDQVGKGYDYGTVLNFVIPSIKQRNDRWACAELIAFGLTYASSVFPATIESSEYSPRDLYLLCKLHRI